MSICILLYLFAYFSLLLPAANLHDGALVPSPSHDLSTIDDDGNLRPAALSDTLGRNLPEPAVKSVHSYRVAAGIYVEAGARERMKRVLNGEFGDSAGGGMFAQIAGTAAAMSHVKINSEKKPPPPPTSKKGGRRGGGRGRSAGKKRGGKPSSLSAPPPSAADVELGSSPSSDMLFGEVGRDGSGGVWDLLNTIAVELPGLQELSMSGCAAVDSAALSALDVDFEARRSVYEAVILAGAGNTARGAYGGGGGGESKVAAAASGDDGEAGTEGKSASGTPRDEEGKEGAVTVAAAGTPRSPVLIDEKGGGAPETPGAGSSIPCRPLGLVTLDLSACEYVGDPGMVVVAACCPRLQSLRLSLCDQEMLTDASLVAVAASCPHLRILELSGCGQFTDKAITKVAQGCAYLERVLLDGCSEITNESLRAVGMGCHELGELNLTGCTQVTNEGVSNVLFGCRHLTLLNLNLCAKVTDEFVDEQRARFKAVLVIVRTLSSYSDPTHSGLLDGLAVPKGFEDGVPKKGGKKKGGKKKGGKKKKK